MQEVTGDTTAAVGRYTAATEHTQSCQSANQNKKQSSAPASNVGGV